MLLSIQIENSSSPKFKQRIHVLFCFAMRFIHNRNSQGVLCSASLGARQCSDSLHVDIQILFSDLENRPRISAKSLIILFPYLWKQSDHSVWTIHPKALQGRPEDHQRAPRIPKGCPRTQMGPPRTSRGAKSLQGWSKSYWKRRLIFEIFPKHLTCLKKLHHFKTFINS